MVDKSVSLMIYENGLPTEFWKQVRQPLRQQASDSWKNGHRLSDSWLIHESAIFNQMLEIYGASTNWGDKYDPIWFPDEESRTLFILTWS